MWAFSFGLIKGQLADLDPFLVAFLRLLLSALVFLPWTVRSRPRLGVLATGAVQFGLMYVFYLASFAWLPAWGVALWTIFTPLYVTWLEDLLAGRWSGRGTAAALFAVAGAAVVQTGGVGAAAGAWRGILLLQAANLCFAGGQVAFRRLAREGGGGAAGGAGLVGAGGAAAGGRAAGRGAPEASLLGWMYVGAAGIAALAALLLGDPLGTVPDAPAWLALAYLGVAPTAIGFYLWNKGAVRVGAGALAAANNLKVPLAVAVSWLVFGESAAYGRVLAGLGIVTAALFLGAGRGGGGAGRAPAGRAERRQRRW